MRLARTLGLGSFTDLHRWSATERAAFWGQFVDSLAIPWTAPPRSVLDGSGEDARWLVGARFNVADLCFRAGAKKTPHSQEMHITALHAVSEVVENVLFGH
jgi:acetyl-CoA synthetase